MSVGETTANLLGYLGKATQWGREMIGASIQDILHYTGVGANDTQPVHVFKIAARVGFHDLHRTRFRRTPRESSQAADETSR